MNRLQLWILRKLVRKAVIGNRQRLITNLMVQEHQRHWTEDNHADIDATMTMCVRTSMLWLKDQGRA